MFETTEITHYSTCHHNSYAPHYLHITRTKFSTEFPTYYAVSKTVSNTRIRETMFHIERHCRLHVSTPLLLQTNPHSKFFNLRSPAFKKFRTALTNVRLVSLCVEEMTPRTTPVKVHLLSFRPTLEESERVRVGFIQSENQSVRSSCDVATREKQPFRYCESNLGITL